MSNLDQSIKHWLREDSLSEVRVLYPNVQLPSSFEEALIKLENGKIEEVKAFLLFYTIYSEKCEEAAKKQTESMDIDDSTGRFLKNKLNDLMKDI